jgi:hypothetical protein
MTEEGTMRARFLVCGAALAAAGVSPALADLRIDRSEVQGGALVVTGQVSPPSAVTVGVGLDAIVVMPDANGRFVWIGNQVPPSCAVSVARGGERVRAGIAACGINPPMIATTSATTQYGASGGWRADQPAPGSDGQGTTTAATTTGASWSESTTTTRTTLRRRTGLSMISPNDPRYGLSDPPHGGLAEPQGARSGELIHAWPPRGFYANVRSRDGG